MLRSLIYSVTFPSTGRTFANEIQFDQGLTSITGANEAGKSLVLEFVSYLLFGTAALRGAASDYKNFKGTLVFDVRGVTYRVTRRGSKAELFRGDEPVAAGTKPVNAEIIRLLGYDWRVFQMGNLCSQGKIEALGDMKPAERKRAVDQTIGLSVLDDLAKWCNDNATRTATEADTLERVMGERPTEPTKPEGYQPSAELKVEFETLMKQEAERVGIEAWLRTKPAVPTKPTPPCPESADDLQAQVNERTTMQQEVKRLQAKVPPGDCDVAAVVESWKLYHLVEEKRRALAGVQDPGVTIEQLDLVAAQWALYHRWQAKQRLLGQGHHECPACHHTWAVAGDALAAYADVPDEVARPSVDEANVSRLRRMAVAWESSADARARYADVPDGAPLPKMTEAEARAYDPNAAHDLAILTAKLEKMPDRSDALARRRRYEAELQVYQLAEKALKEWEVEAAVRRKRLEALADVPARAAQVKAAVDVAVFYEYQEGEYRRRIGEWDRRAAEAAELRRTSTAWQEAKRTVGELRSRVKQYLLPSLNGVASALIDQMTGGQRRSIVVDDDFEVTVDGQALNTLSGSGKAVANLSLRIALGLVLTNRVFSVFMGDELDASMDADRTGFTAEALSRLTDSIGQVLLVSHKQFDADNVIGV